MRKYLLLATAILVIGFSMAVSIPSSPFLLNWLTQKDISDMFPTAITPAPFTFSIWSVIYFSWVVLGILVALGKVSLTKKQISVFVTAILLTAVWLVPWSYLWIGSALVVLLVLLATVWYLFSLTKKEKPLIRNTVELFMGWIHIATFANLAAWFQYAGLVWDGGEKISWGIGVLTLAFFATLFFQIRYRTHIVSLVYLWASIGIYFGQPHTLLTNFLIGYALIIAGVTGFAFFKKR